MVCAQKATEVTSWDSAEVSRKVLALLLLSAKNAALPDAMHLGSPE